MNSTRTACRRVVAAVGLTATVAALFAAAPGQAVATPKPTPPPQVSAQQVSAAHQAQDAVAAQVGALGAAVAQEQVQLAQSLGRQELAEQKVALAVSKLRDAQDAAQRARQHESAAQHSVVAAHAKFVAYVQATYTSGGVGGTTGSLLTASNPTELLDRSTLEQYQASNQVDAIGTLQAATIARSNAEAAARRAVRDQADRAAQAKSARQAADNAVAAEQANRASLQTSLVSSQHQLDDAQSQLATLTHQRSAYLAYRAEQARLARIAAAKALRERLARLAAERAAAAAAQAARAAERAAARDVRHHRRGGGHSSSGGGSVHVPVSSGPSAPSSGGWTAAKGRQAVQRAMSALGTPYAWAGGGASGPSRGVCDASNGAPNDCYVTGYDCSGLTLYAWGKHWDHYAAHQYYEAGSYHPSAGQLKPGDLIFWSFGGQAAIHHVAIYKGGGQIIEAPYSGGYVQVAPLYEYGSFYGATRPLT